MKFIKKYWIIVLAAIAAGVGVWKYSASPKSKSKSSEPKTSGPDHNSPAPKEIESFITGLNYGAVKYREGKRFDLNKDGKINAKDIQIAKERRN